MARDWLDAHRATLEGALEASETRGYWSAYPEVPSGRVYGETAKDDGLAAWKSRLGTKFDLGQPGQTSWVSAETSPYGIETGVQYQRFLLGIR